jgi:hypothetical protein
VQFAPGGHHDHHPCNCCCACAASHQAALLPAGDSWLAPLAAVAWQVTAEQAAAPRDTVVLRRQSRAPPA